MHSINRSSCFRLWGSEYERLNAVILKQRYRVSCQAALWRKQELLEIIREQESAWEFEEFGSQRSGIMGHKYLVVDKTWIRLDVFEIIPYIFTGIIQGDGTIRSFLCLKNMELK